MNEDLLKRAERIRLEALNQAVVSVMHSNTSPRLILMRAKTFETWILKGEVPSDN